MTAQATRLRAIATDHTAARVAIPANPGVVAATHAARAVSADARQAVNAANRALTRGWGLSHLRSRVNHDPIRTAAMDVTEGRRSALEVLPSIAIASLPSAEPALSRRRGRAA